MVTDTSKIQKNDKNNPRQGRSRRRRQRNQEESQFIERVIKIRRVSKVVKGGRNLTFNAMVVVGDGNGKVGAGLGSAAAVPDAVRKGTIYAKKKYEQYNIKWPYDTS